MPAIVQVAVTILVAPTPATLQQTGAIISQGATIEAPWATPELTQLSDLTPLLPQAAQLATLAYLSGVVTATASAAHGLPIGQVINLTIAGSSPAGYNGTFPCTITTTTEFTYPVGTSLGATTAVGTWINANVVELVSMVTTYFAQGNLRAVYILELGPSDVNHGIASLSAYLTANPNINYTSGSTGYFYAYLVPREWDGNSNYLSLLASFQSTTAKTYFFTTTTLATYKLYTQLMKCVFPLIEAPAYNAFPANALTAISYNGGTVTGTTTTAHGVTAGTWFSIAGVTPSGYNGTFLALPGTSGTTLIYSLPADPGTESVLGTLVASMYSSAGIPATEFSLASAFHAILAYAPSSTNRVTPTAFAFLFGVTPFPTKGNNSLLQTLQNAFVNVVGTGAEGGISNAILLNGTTADGQDFTYWYSVDWVQINCDLNVSNAIINGSNSPLNPLYYNQDGINRLEQVVADTIADGVSFGLVLFSPVQTGLDGPALGSAINAGTYTGYSLVNAVPFLTYCQENPGDYKEGAYNGLSVLYTPSRGFVHILINVTVSQFVAQ